MLISSEPDFLSQINSFRSLIRSLSQRRDFVTQPVSQVSKNRHISMKMHSPSVGEKCEVSSDHRLVCSTTTGCQDCGPGRCASGFCSGTDCPFLPLSPCRQDSEVTVLFCVCVAVWVFWNHSLPSFLTLCLYVLVLLGELFRSHLPRTAMLSLHDLPCLE